MTQRIVPVGLLLCAIAFAAFPLMSFDLPLDLGMGRTIAARSAVPATNVVLHPLADRPVANPRWLHQLAVYTAERWLDSDGLLGLRALLLGLTALCLYRLGRGLGASAGAAGMAVLIVGLLLVHRAPLGPWLWTYLLVPATVLLHRRLRTAERAWPWIAALVAAQVAWANLDVFWPLGVATALAFAWRPNARVVWCAGLVAAAAVVHPRGIANLSGPIDYVRLAMDAATRGPAQAPVWSSLLPWTPPRIALVVAAALAVAGLLRRRTGLPLPLTILSVVWIAVGVIEFRNLPLAGLGLAPWIACNPLVRIPAVAPLGAAVLATALVLAGPWSDPAADGRTVGRGWAEGRFPSRSVDFLLQKKPAGELFNDIASGNYWIYRAFPERRAFIDGNRAGYDRTFLERYRSVLSLATPHQALTRSDKVTHYLLRHDLLATRHLICALFRDERMILAEFDHATTVFVDRVATRGLPDGRKVWLERVLPTIRDRLYPKRKQAAALLDRAGSLLARGLLDPAKSLIRQAIPLDPWKARSFRLIAAIAREENDKKREAMAWRSAALLEGQPIRDPRDEAPGAGRR